MLAKAQWLPSELPSQRGHARSDLIAGIAVIPRDMSASQATSSIRCSVRRASADVMSALREEHLQSVHAGSSSSCSIRACAEDLTFMHHSPAEKHPCSRGERRPPKSSEYYDVSALATTVTLFGPGDLINLFGTCNCICTPGILLQIIVMKYDMICRTI